MSRAFVREADGEVVDALPARPVSPHPNFVTPEGLAAIESQVRELEARKQAAREAEDADELARVTRELRYWSERRASARLVEPPGEPDVVRFGVRATVRWEDGSEQCWRVVGEDEADPTQGLVSWVSPLGRALTGRGPGDAFTFQGREIEVVWLSS